MKNSNMFKGYLFVILSAIIYGLMPLMAKFIYLDGVNPVTLVFLRNILAVPMLMFLSIKTKSVIKTDLKTFGKISFVAIMGCCLTPLLLFISYNHIPSGTATVIHFIYPAIVVIGEWFIFKSKLYAGKVLSVVLCVAGITLFYNPNEGINVIGGGYALLSGITYAIYVISLHTLKNKSIHIFTLGFYVTLVCSFVMMLVCIVTNQLALPTSFSGWLLSILFAFALNVGAVLFFQRGTFLIGGSRAAILSTFEPITSILAGTIILKEALSNFTVIGTILVISAGVLIAVCDIRKTTHSS